MICQHFTAAGADYKLGSPIVIGIARGDTAHRVVQFAAVAFLVIAGAIEAENNQPPEVVGGWRAGASVNQSVAGHDADFGVVRAIQLGDRDAERGVDIAALERLREAAAAAVEDVEVTVGPLVAVGQPVLARIAGRNHDFVIRIIIKVSHLNSHWQLVQYRADPVDLVGDAVEGVHPASAAADQDFYRRVGIDVAGADATRVTARERVECAAAVIVAGRVPRQRVARGRGDFPRHQDSRVATMHNPRIVMRQRNRDAGTGVHHLPRIPLLIGCERSAAQPEDVGVAAAVGHHQLVAVRPEQVGRRQPVAGIDSGLVGLLVPVAVDKDRELRLLRHNKLINAVAVEVGRQHPVDQGVSVVVAIHVLLPLQLLGFTVEDTDPALLRADRDLDCGVGVELPHRDAPDVLGVLVEGRRAGEVEIPLRLVEGNVAADINLGSIGVDDPQVAAVGAHRQLRPPIAVKVAQREPVRPPLGPLGVRPGDAGGPVGLCLEGATVDDAHLAGVAVPVVANRNLERVVVIELRDLHPFHRATEVDAVEALHPRVERAVPVEHVQVALRVADQDFVLAVGVNVGDANRIQRAEPVTEAGAPRFAQVAPVSVGPRVVSPLRYRKRRQQHQD